MSTIRVAFDDQIFEAQSRGGISKYFVELVKRLPDHGIEPIMLPTRTRNLHLAESGLVERAPDLRRISARASWFTWRVVGHPRSQPRSLPEFDVLHHTFSHPSYLGLGDKPRVTTVFDMTPELMPEYFKWGNPHFAKRKYCERSDAIISISQNTADDMMRLYGKHLVSKTHVIPFGVGSEFLKPVTDRRLELPDRYVLFVGVRRGYKDFATAVAAFDKLAAAMPDLHLVVVGGGPLEPSEIEPLVDSGVAERVRQLRPSDTDMPEVYSRAAAFVFPSRYEGFGLPTLEALSTGTPTVLADASCSREVGGEAPEYFAPGDVDDLVRALTTAMTTEVVERTKALGPARGSEFSWDRVASMTADLYRSLI